MPILTDKKMTADEADALASPYIVSMNALFKEMEVDMMTAVEDMVKSGATENEIINAVEKILS